MAQGAIENYSKAELSQLMTGRDIDASRYRHASASEETLLQLQELGCREYFRQASFTLKKGEILGITGLMDSGRNELAKTIAGVMASSAGSLSLSGQPLKLNCPADAIGHGIGYVPEDRLGEGLFLDKPILSNMVAAILDDLRSVFGTLDHAKARTVAQALVHELKIATPDVDLPVQSLSGGNQQRVLIARWLTIKPQLLVLHGPTVGVDVGSKDTIYRTIQALAERGLGVILISDDLPELLQNADRILVMRDGQVQQEFVADGAQEDDLYRAMLGTEKGSCSE